MKTEEAKSLSYPEEETMRLVLGTIYYCVICPVIVIVSGFDSVAYWLGLKLNPISRWIDATEWEGLVDQKRD